MPEKNHKRIYLNTEKTFIYKNHDYIFDFAHERCLPFVCYWTFCFFLHMLEKQTLFWINEKVSCKKNNTYMYFTLMLKILISENYNVINLKFKNYKWCFFTFMSTWFLRLIIFFIYSFKGCCSGYVWDEVIGKCSSKKQ